MVTWEFVHIISGNPPLHYLNQYSLPCWLKCPSGVLLVPCDSQALHSTQSLFTSSPTAASHTIQEKIRSLLSVLICESVFYPKMYLKNPVAPNVVGLQLVLEFVIGKSNWLTSNWLKSDQNPNIPVWIYINETLLGVYFQGFFYYSLKQKNKCLSADGHQHLTTLIMIKIEIWPFI